MASKAAADREATTRSRTLKKQKGICRDHGVHLLWCLANCDGEIGDKELDAILDYCTACLSRVSLAPTLKQRGALVSYIRSLRPTAKTINKTVMRLTSLREDVREQFLEGCVAVAKANGADHTDELQTAVNKISQEIAGRDIL